MVLSSCWFNFIVRPSNILLPSIFFELPNDSAVPTNLLVDVGAGSKSNRCHHESDRGVPACSRHGVRRGPLLDPRPPPRRLLVGFSCAEGRQESCSQVNLKGHGWSRRGPGTQHCHISITAIARPPRSPCRHLAGCRCVTFLLSSPSPGPSIHSY